MGTIERDLMECCNGCDSSKVTERKKSMERLSELLTDSRTAKILSRSDNGNNLTWDLLFQSVHRLILKEADRFRAEEQKPQSSSSSQTNRENIKIKCSALIDNVVTKAVRGVPKLKCSTVIFCILQILKDGYLQKCFGCTYLLILKAVLRVRKYWGDVNSDDWNELLDVCFMLYEKPPTGLDKAPMAEILYWIVKCGTLQSHLGLQLRKKFPPLARAFEDSNLDKLPALQASLLKLAITVSQQLAKESRMATCKFGEDITRYVIGLYENRLEDRYDKKGLMFDFLLLQMHLHHPHGTRQGEGAAYAYSWEKWRSQLNSIYRLVDTEIHNVQRNKCKIQVLRENFLQLAVEVCKQVFENDSNVLDVTNVHALNESMSCTMSKRRRVVAGIQAIIEVLSTPGTQDIWPWLSLMSSLFSKYPNILKEQDFIALLRLVAELQSTCKDSIVMGYLCQCCESLLKVEQVLNQAQLNEKEIDLLWLKMWDTTLRTVGLNQSEKSSHNLLQAMILHQKTHLPLNLIYMFLNGTIQLSEHSLQTLQVILKCCDLPETLEGSYNIQSQVPSYQTTSHGPESLRCALLDWLLPNKEDLGLTELNLVPFTPSFMSRLLVELIVKSQCDVDDDCMSDNPCDEKFITNSIEDDYMISSFEMGLRFKICSKVSSCVSENSNPSVKLIIVSARDKLEELMKRDCSLIAERVVMPQDSTTKLKILTDYVSQCLLILSTLSWMIKWNVITSCDLPTFSLTGAVQKMMDQLASLAKGMLVISRMETDLPVVLCVLHTVQQLFEVELHEDVIRLVQELTPTELLDAVYKVISTMKHPQEEISMELNKLQFPMKEDCDDVIMDSSGSSIIEEASCSVLDVRHLTEKEKVQTEAVGLLCSYSCCFTGKMLSGQSSTEVTRLLQFLLEDKQPTSSLCYFQMRNILPPSLALNSHGITTQKTNLNIFTAVRTLNLIQAVAVIRRALSCSELREDHVSLILRIIQALCRKHYLDHEAALIILQLLCGVFRHAQDTVSRENSKVLLKAFQKNVDIKKKYGPEVSIQYIKCLGELAVVDPNVVWATWESGTPVDNGVKGEITPIAEEVLIHIKSPFHEMRMTAVNYVGTLFSHQSGASHNANRLAWQKRMFDKLCFIIISSFIVEGDLTMEEKVDESANRTASALHCFAALTVASPLWRKKALFSVLQLVKEKNLNTDLVRKVLVLVGKSLKLPNITKLMETNLNYVLVHWRLQQYALQDFPWVLFDCTSDTEFFTKYQEVIVPILLQREEDESLELVSRKVGTTLAKLVELCCPRIIACWVPCFAADLSDGLKDMEVQIAKRLYRKLEQILLEDRITYHLNHQLDRVIFHIMRLLFDPEHFGKLCGVSKDTLSDPDSPYFSISTILKSLLYLQENSPKPQLPLVVYLAKESSDCIQKILLSLAVDIHQVPTLEDKLKSLHRYATFADILVQELSVRGDGLGDMATFIIRDVSHTLIHLMKQSYQREEFPLAVASCHFYRLFCSKCLPACCSIVQTFLLVIVNVLVPLAKLNGDLGAESRALLRFLVVENSELLSSAIEMLDPFPGDTIFEEVHEVYTRIVQVKRIDTLKESIRYFLNAGNKNLGCRAEGLKHLRTQLSKKKQELSVLYKELNDMRGFSEDCAKSLLHQLICMLVKLTSVPDSRIRREASRCLGELGPADLTTMILKLEKSQELQENVFRNNSSLMFTAHIVSVLVDYLVDENIIVVEAASAALYKILASWEGQQVIVGSSGFNNQYIIPFKKTDRITRHNSLLTVNEDVFKETVNVDSLWCPLEECSHEKWVITLVCTILKTFQQEDCFISQLVPVCSAKVSFAEQILPLLVSLVLSTDSKVCRAIMNRCICYFFKSHFETRLQLDKGHSTSPLPVLRHCKEQVCFNRASVQCMLNVVHFARLQKCLKLIEWEKDISSQCLELNYLHVAQAAQFCSAYFTSILYAELWCDDNRESMGIDCAGGQSVSALEYICDRSAQNGKALQNILKEAYKKIGDDDAVYGCGSSHILDPRTRIRHFELIGNWQNVLLSYDFELSNGNEDAAGGMLFALKRLGLYHIQNSYLSGGICSEYEDYQYECGWRLGQWNLLSTENRKELCGSKSDIASGLESLIAKGEYEKHHYMSLKAMHDLDFTSVERAVAAARKCVIDSLAHASLECSKNLYHALSQLQTLQEIEDFVSAWKSGEVDNIEAVLDKWKKQGQLNLSEFQYMEPILAQRAVLLQNAMLVERNDEMRQQLAVHLADIRLSTAKLARTEGWHHVGERCLCMLSRVGRLSSVVEGQLKLEQAQLSCGKGDHEVGRCILRSLLGELSLIGDGTNEDKLLYSSALTLYGNWMVETRSENSQVIVDRYFKKSLNILEGVQYSEESQLETYSSLARFVDAEYQQLMGILNSSAFESKQQFMTKAREEADKLQQQQNKTKDENRKIQMCQKMSIIDEAEMKNREKEKNMYLKDALKYYLLSLEHGVQHSLQVFRLTSLWLENTAHDEVCEVVRQYVHRIPSYKFLPVLPQLAPRISNSMSDPFVRELNALLQRCAMEHPHHTLPIILALANSYRDQDFTGGRQNERKSEPRVLGAQHIVHCLKAREEVRAILTQMEGVATALITLAYYEVEGKSKSYPIQMTLLKQLQDNELVLVPTLTIPVKNNCQYDDIVGIQKYADTFSLVGGVNAPKKVECVGTDGIKRPQLVKGKDDLRQDAVMQQVFTILNTLLKNNKETQKRKLLIRTYKVVPLSQRSGILEWCQNTEPMATYLMGPNGAHCRYYPKDFTPQACRKAMIAVAQSSNERKLQTYNRICKSFHPVFRYFFLENFLTPGVWFERRLAYIHSVATSSMIGYILGLGDRHTVNILVDKSTAEVIHIDFGIAFEQGHILPTPETVPFRLTRDVEDGMGVSGIEGVFRRCCEKTMSVLRQNQETILTILEVLLYDPLYAWTISPSKGYNIQKRAHKANLNYNEPEATAGEVNRMAERALVRLRQKLQGTEEGTATSVGGQVNRLLQQARDPGNLSRLYHGWQPYL